MTDEMIEARRATLGVFDWFRRRGSSPAGDRPSESRSEDDLDLPAPATPDQLHALFDLPNGTTITDDGRTITLEHLVVGELAFPSGRVAFCDPLVGDGTLFVTVPPETVGRASALGVRLAPDHLRVAALALDVGPGPVSAWTMYVPEGESLEQGAIWGFGVDAGVACFADPMAIDALHALQARYYDQPGPLTGPEPVVDEMYGGDRSVHALIYDVEPGLQLAIGRSGWGDGLYATYIGTDADQQMVRLMISFDVLSADHSL